MLNKNREGSAAAANSKAVPTSTAPPAESDDKPNETFDQIMEPTRTLNEKGSEDQRKFQEVGAEESYFGSDW